MRIIFVRHGETPYNRESRYQGHTDIPLSEKGEMQAARVAERLKHEKIDAVYASDLSRAKATGEAIAAYHNLPVQTDEAFRECGFGKWEGLTVTEIKERYSELYANYTRDSVTYRADGGERLEALQERVVTAVNRLAAAHPNDTVVIATHGGPIRAFTCYAIGAELTTFRKMQLDNCGITSFLFENGKWVLEVLNDACHVESLKALQLAHDETGR